MMLSEYFVETFKRYLRKHGIRILAIAKLTGQKKVKIGLKGLYRYYVEYSPNYPKLEQLVKAIISSEKEKSLLDKIGLKLVRMNDELYIELSVNKLEELIRETGT